MAQKSAPWACIGSGYKYLYHGKRAGALRASDERFETVMRGKVCGRVLGTRSVDGSRVVLVAHRGRVYAALPSHVRTRGK